MFSASFGLNGLTRQTDSLYIRESLNQFMKTPVTFIHLGLPKTATSCLQMHLFRNHSQVHYFGKFKPGGLPASVRPVLLTGHCKIRELEPGDVRETDIQNQLVYAAENNLTPVLSEEGLACGWVWKKMIQARMLKKAFGNCQILFLIREPVSFVRSYYTQMLKDFHRKKSMKESWVKPLGPPPHYFDINEWMSAAWVSLNPPSQFLRTADTARIYAKVFGKENVQLFLFEEFVQNPETFITGLCDHLGIDPKEGFDLIDGKRANDGITTGYIRRLQEIEQSEDLARQFRNARPKERKQMLNPADPSGEKFQPKLSGKWLKKINALGDKQNRLLAANWNLPLADFGYRL